MLTLVSAALCLGYTPGPAPRGAVGHAQAHLLHPVRSPLLQPRVAPPALLLGLGSNSKAGTETGGAATAATPMTLGAAKTAFFASYGRPVVDTAQPFVNEMLSACTVAMASPNFQYTRVFALGFESLCSTFLEGQPGADAAAIRAGLCAGLGLDSAAVKRDSEALTAEAGADGFDEAALFASADFEAIGKAVGFKYSYPYGAGLLTLMPMVGEERSQATAERWCEQLGQRPGQLKKDLAFYESAIEKLSEVQQMLMEMQAAQKRKEARDLKDAASKAAAEAEAAEADAAAADGAAA